LYFRKRDFTADLLKVITHIPTLVRKLSMMLSFSHQLTIKYSTRLYFGKNLVRHRRRKQLYTGKDTSNINEGEFCIDVLRKYIVTINEYWHWKDVYEVNSQVSYLNLVWENFSHRSVVKPTYLLEENRRLRLELGETNKLIQKLERRKKQYMQAIEMYNRITAEYESTESI